MKFYKWICLLLALCFLVPPVYAEGELDLISEAAVLMDAETGQVLYAKNAYQQMYPASITKVMTGLLALRELDPRGTLTVTQTAVRAVPETSSHISLEPGEQMTVDMAMYAIATMSANDVANVLAEAVSGSLEAFAVHMTETAHALGAVNTNFTNANGLPDRNHYTTAYDMALITAEALKVPGFTDYFSTVDYVFPATNLSGPRTFTNKNRMLPGAQYAYAGLLMSKTGMTSAAQYTLVTAARRGNTTLIAVTLKSPNLEDKYQDTTALLDYGFTHFERINLSGEELAERLDLGDYLPISGQQTDFLMDVSNSVDDLTFRLPEDARLKGTSPTVRVRPFLGDTELPVLELTLERKPPETLAVVALLQDEEFIETTVTVTVSGMAIAAILGGLFFLITAARGYAKQRRRRNRRRALAAKIRRMKRQMGKRE